jgi:hypothetical protein
VLRPAQATGHDRIVGPIDTCPALSSQDASCSCPIVARTCARVAVGHGMWQGRAPCPQPPAAAARPAPRPRARAHACRPSCCGYCWRHFFAARLRCRPARHCQDGARRAGCPPCPCLAQDRPPAACRCRITGCMPSRAGEGERRRNCGCVLLLLCFRVQITTKINRTPGDLIPPCGPPICVVWGALCCVHEVSIVKAHSWASCAATCVPAPLTECVPGSQPHVPPVELRWEGAARPPRGDRSAVPCARVSALIEVYPHAVRWDHRPCACPRGCASGLGPPGALLERSEGTAQQAQHGTGVGNRGLHPQLLEQATHSAARTAQAESPTSELATRSARVNIF